MTAYIIRRLIWALVLIILLTMLVFFGMRLLPGDPILIYVASTSAYSSMSPEAIDLLRAQYNLDKPLWMQYFLWVGDIFQGNLGKSITYHEDVGALLARRLPITLHIGVVGFIVATILGTASGLLAGLRRGKLADQIITPLTYVGISIPVFWLAVLMLLIFGLYLRWLPIGNYTSPFDNFWLNTKQLIMPVACQCITSLAGLSRQMRSSVLEVVQQDYIRTAWSKGLRERVIVLRHMLKNSLIPVITLMGFAIGLIFGGSVFIEQIFNIPGVGRLLVEAIFGQDYVVVQATTLIFGGIVLVVNLLVDISYGWLDPRIRY
jgi:peptide/nickel transport system permease protein